MEFGSAIEFVDQVIESACMAGASDIHLHPGRDNFIVRLRINGVLSDKLFTSLESQPEIIARIKILASLRIDERSLPQDGRFKKELITGEEVDIRVSITATHRGEQAVLRVLRSETNLDTLKQLGMLSTHQAVIDDVLKRKKGMIIVTGPTGSGKTSTSYALLRLLNTRDISIITIEDPVEYTLDGVTQIGVHQNGFTFTHALRGIVRQDPDVLFVGEIRDRETADLATHAALTGHLVITTLHTIDAPTALVRLLTLGIEPYVLASAVELVIAQRLVRTPSNGRIGIFELLRLDASNRDLLINSPHELSSTKESNSNLLSFAEDCLKKVELGLIEQKEVENYV